MRFSCDECGRTYVAGDEVAGRAFRMRCKQCGHEILVRAAAAAAAAPTPTPTPRQAASASGSASAVTPPPVASKPRQPTPAPADAPTSSRPAFDPFEGEEVAPDVAVATESLEILDRTPPAVRLPRTPPAPARPAVPPAPAARSSTARAPLPPRVRPGRMLPAEDEEKLGPPGEEGRRSSISRWIIALVVAGLAAAGGLLLRR